MNTIYDTYKPEGFSTINLYLFSEDPARLIQFFKNALYADELSRTMGDDGVIRNCILKMGKSCFMIGQARDQFLGMRSAAYLFVDDVDSLHEHALRHGAKEEFPPADMDYRDRQSGIIDPDGNYWWLSKRLDEIEYED